MGRATFESLPGTLSGRTSIVIGSKPLLQTDAHFVATFEEAVDCAMNVETSAEAIAFIGGESIYRQALKLDWLRRAYITDVDVDVPGDRFMPELGSDWSVHDSYDLAPGTSPRCQFTEYRRLPQKFFEGTHIS